LSAHAAPANRHDGSLVSSVARGLSRHGPLIAVAAALCAICFGATDGNELTIGTGLVENTVLQISLTIAGGALLAAACAAGLAGRARIWGAGCAMLMLALAALTAASVTWSVAPANSWLEANRTFAYAATFIGALSLARLAATRWRSVLGGALLATVVVSLYALLVKVFPASLDGGDTLAAYARIHQPFGDWNAVGLTAALGVVPCLWLGARREGHGLLNALAAPALCALLVAVLLSFSRGALAAAVIGAGLWFAFVPLRLRGLATALTGGAAAAAVIAYAYTQPALVDDHVGLAARTAAGHRLGAALLVALAVAFAVAVATRFATDRRAPGPALRRRAGTVALVCLALVPVAAIGALAHSSRGLGGSISHAWGSLTSPAASQTASNPGRLTTVANNHSLYWRYAREIFDANPVTGAGAGSFPVADQRYMTGPAIALQAHSYVFETLAGLGLAGLAISLALAGAWLLAAIRTGAPWRARAPGADAAERIGLVTMIATVVVFAIDSAIDRSWFVPGDAVIALLCAGWVAGRGPWGDALGRRPSRRRLQRSPAAALCALAALAVALLVAWTQWQPLRSEQAANAGATLLDDSYAALGAKSLRLAREARDLELTAVSRDPLDIGPLDNLALAYVALGQDRLAQRTFEREVQLQPSNAYAWRDLGLGYQQLGMKRAATSALATALYLGPWVPDAKKLYLESLTPPKR
jgi:hypothetical protein